MKPLIIALSLLLTVAVQAQQDTYFIVMNATGDATYYTGSVGQKLFLNGGETLGPDATLVLSAGAQVDLVYKNQSMQFSKPGKYALAEYEITEEDDSGTWGFFRRFYDYIKEGILNTGNQNSVEKYHERYISKASGGIRGFAGGGYGVQITTPVTGRVDLAPTIFSWFSVGDSLIYDFQIYDYQSDGLLYKAVLKDTVARVDFRTLALEPGRKYYWMVERKHTGEPAPMFTLSDDPGQRSPKVEFVVEPEAVAEALKGLSELEEYQEQEDQYQRLLMTALYMEDQQLIREAHNNYEALRTSSPDPPVVRTLYAAFLIRQGLLKAGEAVLNP
jgi:hypothetical protein